jgi:hypothetical protein
VTNIYGQNLTMFSLALQLLPTTNFSAEVESFFLAWLGLCGSYRRQTFQRKLIIILFSLAGCSAANRGSIPEPGAGYPGTLLL